ncbi:MAG: pgl [Thermoleophilia bacterium]|nr:pgl [Thermoleophilia bacterium]
MSGSNGTEDDVHEAANRAMQLWVVEDFDGAAAEVVAQAVRRGGHVALAGGDGPQGAYARLAAMDLDWSGVTVWFSDERVVPRDDGRSNTGAARRSLLDHVRPRSIELVRTELGAEAAAADYARRIRDSVPIGDDGVPRFDLVLLGLGPDGHTGSLPPRGGELDATALVVGVPNPSLPPLVPRVTFALPLLAAAAHVVFHVGGPETAAAVHAAFFETPSRATPGSLVHPADGALTVLLDPESAPDR